MIGNFKVRSFFGSRAQIVHSCLLAATTAVALVACGGGNDRPQSPPSAPPTGEAGGNGSAATASPKVKTLSARPDLVTGGDVLIEVSYPADVDPKSVRLHVNGVDATSQLSAPDSGAHAMRGLISGLNTAPGGATNRLVVSTTASGESASELVVTSYPISGPVLSGPHITPYECRTIENGLGAPLDADCSANTKVVWYYHSTDGTFKPLVDPLARPSDVATTTTNAGVTVPYIVRVESGTVNRGIYRLAILDDPKSALPTGYTPSPGWNGKLVVAFGGGGYANYNQGVQPIESVLSDRELSRGFALMNSTELINNQHANPHLQGETLMMLKEHFIEQVGIPKWTAGTGGSGGAIQQYLVAQLYPGLLDGIQPEVSFPESMNPEVAECRLLNTVYRTDPARWSLEKQDAINGYSRNTCVYWEILFAGAFQSENAFACGVLEPANAGNIYNATTNPNGLRCDFFQTNVNLLGVKPGTKKARRPFDNTGVQYGLAALNSGAISVDDFLELNARVGGSNDDGNLQAARSVGDAEALRATYAGGFKNSFTGPGLATIPIITWRSNADVAGDIHDPMQDLIVRARLTRANGNADNQIIWASGTKSGVDLSTLSLDTINAWLDAIVADPAPASLEKVKRLKPSGATDACWDPSGQRIDETMSLNPATACNRVYPRFKTPRLVAGAQLTNDALKCQLRPISMSDYVPSFTPSQSSQLQATFPDGVCDWSKPGVEQVPLKGTYLRLPLD